MTHRRRDAARNQERVQQAAARLFARRGTSTSLKAVADLAGVGIGTVYRHVPDKQALIAELMRPEFERVHDLLARAEATADPGESFYGFVRDLAALLAQSAGVRELFIDPRPLPGSLRDDLDGIFSRFEPVFTRAQQAGVLRADLDVMDLVLLVGALHGAESLFPTAPGISERLLGLLIDGLVPHRDHPTPIEPAPLSRDVMTE